MRISRFAVAGAVVLALLPVAAAPAQAAETRQPANGRPVEVAALPAALRLAGAGRAWRVAYRSTSWNSRPTVVTGTITVPPGRPPAGGWTVVSFGHGFGGSADACAPSRT